MTSPDYQTFVEGFGAEETVWLAANPSPSGTDFLDHYAGDTSHPNGFLWRYEAWHREHGYVPVRPWNGFAKLFDPLQGALLRAVRDRLSYPCSFNGSRQ